VRGLISDSFGRDARAACSTMTLHGTTLPPPEADQARGMPQEMRPMSKHALSTVLLVLAMIATPGCGGDDPPARETLADLEFPAFIDTITSETQTVRFSDYFAENRPGTRIIMINAAAGWCVPCMREAAALAELAAEYEPRGVAILTAVFQDQNGDPADADFVRAWCDSFELPVPVLIDTEFQTGVYFDAATMPANMFVDAETHEILQIATGAETGDDPLREYRELLDHYLQ
jgi:thiol-disulfide isomerase/thioredoxin